MVTLNAERHTVPVTVHRDIIRKSTLQPGSLGSFYGKIIYLRQNQENTQGREMGCSS